MTTELSQFLDEVTDIVAQQFGVAQHMTYLGDPPTWEGELLEAMEACRTVLPEAAEFRGFHIPGDADLLFRDLPPVARLLFKVVLKLNPSAWSQPTRFYFLMALDGPFTTQSQRILLDGEEPYEIPSRQAYRLYILNPDRGMIMRTLTRVENEWFELASSLPFSSIPRIMTPFRTEQD